MQAVTALTGTVGNLIAKLGKLLTDEYKLQKGLKEKVSSLRKDLESAYASLREVDASLPDQLDEQVKLWARDIREAAYDMEDVVDIFLVRVEGCDCPEHDNFLKLLGEKMTKMFSKIKERHKIAGEIEKIKKRLQEAEDRRATFTVKSIVAKPAASLSTFDPRLRDLYQTKDLIGIDESIDDVISMLDNGSNEKKKIVSILGAGGLGKTTITKEVYDKHKELPTFSCRAFVSIGQNPDLKKVLRDILIDLGKKEYMDLRYKELDHRHLMNQIINFLIGKRYIIVIDDVWETRTREMIKLALVENNRGSRIIITTRISQDYTGKVYNLRPLSVDSSRKLFCTRLFHEDKFPANEPPEVNEASDKILRKCGGVPLAIVTMASFLVGKPREEWFEVCRKISFIKDKETKWILSLSFNDLPPHLRTCLLYLSAFPEDYEIDKDHLIWKWVAEGFVHTEQGMRLFEVGEVYFNDLVNRSMIQAVESEQTPGVICGCRVHDMVLDMVRDVSCKENFFTLPDNVVAATSLGSKARRLAIQYISRKHSLKDKQLDMSKVRSFMAFRCDIWKCISFQGFQLLRVLAIEYCRGTDQPGHLGKLIHLRYLEISGKSIHVLPEEIGDLKFLQSLILAESDIIELPSSVGRLTNLVCLRCMWTKVRSGVIGRLTCLEELEIVIDEDDDRRR